MLSSSLWMVNGAALRVMTFSPGLTVRGKTPQALSSHQASGLGSIFLPLQKTWKSAGLSTTADKAPAATPGATRKRKAASNPESAGNLSLSRMLVLYWTALSQGLRSRPWAR